ncbi:hypothetical protein [Polyangium mundeleinium]|uniref:Uncharacterized protein n=1 Tax=Polyangium mundeleinium TaxID=2995306 RepID=A0ABT5F2F4_9BACT|nr:hypothetical protein [Polyangium mundeleinium]MDC0747779.1 hypothetical protein [Polyangium mundeleinium]
MSRQIRSIEIMDWYDGIVLAIARTSWHPGMFLVSLLSWNQVSRQRVFVLVSLTEAETASIRSASAQWESLTAYLRSLVNTDRDTFLVLWDEATDEVNVEISIALADVRDEVIGQVEDALKPERQRWFDVVRRGS